MKDDEEPAIVGPPAAADRNATPVVAGPVAAADLVAEWLKGRKPTTVAGYRKDLADFASFVSTHGVTLDWFLGLDRGSAHGVALAYKNDQIDSRKLSAATINRRLAALRSVVKLAHQLGRVGWTLSVAGVKKEPRRNMRGPGELEVKRLAKASKSDPTRQGRRDRALFVLMCGLGLRRGEVVAIDVADVRFDTQTVLVVGKGKREKAAVNLSPEAFTAVSEWLALRGFEPGPLFVRLDRARGGETPGRMTGEAVRRCVMRLAKAAGVGVPVRPHGLRHSAVTRLAKGGESLVDIKAFSRHEKLETVMTYVDGANDAAPLMGEKASKGL